MNRAIGKLDSIETKSPFCEAHIHNVLGMNNIALSDYEKAKRNFLITKNITLKHKWDRHHDMIYLYNNISVACNNLGDFECSGENLTKAINLAKELNNPIYALLLENRGQENLDLLNLNVFGSNEMVSMKMELSKTLNKEELGLLSLAKESYNLAIDFCKNKTPIDSMSIAYAFHGLSKCSFWERDFEKTKQQLETSKFYKTYNNNRLIAGIDLGLAKAHFAEKNYQEALNHINAAIFNLRKIELFEKLRLYKKTMMIKKEIEDIFKS